MEQPIEGGTRQEAFAKHVLPEIEVLLRVARSLTRHPADAEDLVQDTLLRAYRAIDRFDGRHPRAWLLTILRNTHANRGRAHRAEVRLSDLEAERAPAAAAEEPEAVVLRTRSTPRSNRPSAPSLTISALSWNSSTSVGSPTRR